jgi:bacteriocin biosynthesis cyclodehydratase domain-containing protein
MEPKPAVYSLAPYCEVLDLDGVLHVGFGSVGLKFSEDADKEFVFLLLGAVSPDRSIDQQFLDSITSKHGRSILGKLLAHRLIVLTAYIPAYNRNHRDHLYYLMSGADPRIVAASLKTKTVCIIGCGGIGCMVAMTLATAGICNLILIDDDIVEIHNISRQFAYTEEDIGKKKVTVLAAYLRKRNSDLKLQVLDCRATFSAGASNVPPSDFVVFSADQRGLIFPANEFFVAARQPFLHICYINDISVWGPFVVPGATGCWHCSQQVGSDVIEGRPDRTAILKAVNSNYICPVLSPLSLTATSLACLDIIKFLTKVGDPLSLNRRVGLWTNNLTIEYQDFSRNPSCPVCGSISPPPLPS